MIEALRHARAEVAARLEELQGVLTSLDGMIDTLVDRGTLASGPKSKAATSKPGKSKPAGGSSGRPPRVSREDLLKILSVPRRLNEVAKLTGLKLGTAYSALNAMVSRGEAVRLGTGTYGVPSAAAPDPEPTKEPTKEPAQEPKAPPAPAAPIRLNGHHAGPISPQVGAVFEFLESEADWFQVTELIVWLKERHPALVARQTQEQDLRVRLIDLARNGKIDRRGTGACAFYKRIVRKPQAAEAEPLKVSVPRDPDAGQY